MNTWPEMKRNWQEIPETSESCFLGDYTCIGSIGHSSFVCYQMVQNSISKAVFIGLISLLIQKKKHRNHHTTSTAMIHSIHECLEKADQTIKCLSTQLEVYQLSIYSIHVRLFLVFSLLLTYKKRAYICSNKPAWHLSKTLKQTNTQKKHPSSTSVHFLRVIMA